MTILHKSIINRDNKSLACASKLVTQHIAWDVMVGAARRESSRDTDDETFARGELFGEVDLVAGRVFVEVDIGDGVSDFDLILISI